MEKLIIQSKGNTNVINITDKIQKILEKSKIDSGIINIFIIHTTASLTIMEYEPGLIKDTKLFFEKLIPKTNDYYHNNLNNDDNAHSHLSASLLSPSLTLPFENNKLALGTWQQIVLIDFDTNPREREVFIKIIKE